METYNISISPHAAGDAWSWSVWQDGVGFDHGCALSEDQAWDEAREALDLMRRPRQEAL